MSRPILEVSQCEGGVQIIPWVNIGLSVAEALGRTLHGKAWVDFNPDRTFVAVHPNSNDPELEKEVLGLTAAFFRDN